MEDQSSSGHWECELLAGDVDRTGVQFVTLQGFNETSLNAQVDSGQTTLFAEGAFISNGQLVVPEAGKQTLGTIGKRGPADSSNVGKSIKKGAGRKLAPGDVVSRTVLVVRVVAPDGAIGVDVPTLSGDIFGTGKASTAVSMRERFLSCSYNEMQMNPYLGPPPSGALVQNGVVEVQISTPVTGQSSTTIKDLAVSALANYLGIAQNKLPNVFNHVMLCLPYGTTGPNQDNPTLNWIAFGKLDI